jgi:hypothetical protein
VTDAEAELDKPTGLPPLPPVPLLACSRCDGAVKAELSWLRQADGRIQLVARCPACKGHIKFLKHTPPPSLRWWEDRDRKRKARRAAAGGRAER